MNRISVCIEEAGISAAEKPHIIACMAAHVLTVTA